MFQFRLDQTIQVENIKKKRCGINGCQAFAALYTMCLPHSKGIYIWSADLFEGKPERTHHKFLDIEGMRSRSKYREDYMVSVYGECVGGGKHVWHGERLVLISDSIDSALIYTRSWTGRRMKWRISDGTTPQT